LVEDEDSGEHCGGGERGVCQGAAAEADKARRGPVLVGVRSGG
jgi:hypothetical protein